MEVELQKDKFVIKSINTFTEQGLIDYMKREAESLGMEVVQYNIGQPYVRIEYIPNHNGNLKYLEHLFKKRIEFLTNLNSLVAMS